jgi:hypothetical protein
VPAIGTAALSPAMNSLFKGLMAAFPPHLMALGRPLVRALFGLYFTV